MSGYASFKESLAARRAVMWVRVSDRLPDEGVVVDTVISDADGIRNDQPLKRTGSLWFYPDGSMYVYYTPTHWRPLT